jgi:hypothetical protein
VRACVRVWELCTLTHMCLCVYACVQRQVATTTPKEQKSADDLVYTFANALTHDVVCTCCVVV